MTRHASILLASLLVASACATTPPAAPESCSRLAATKAPPARFVERANQFIDEARDPVAAYDCLVSLRDLYPDSPEAEEAFPLAAVLFRRMYYLTRYTEPGSRWLTSEQEFLFGWLAHYARDEFPQRKAEFLLRGMPYPFFASYESFARTDAALGRFHVRVVEDNGIIETVTAEPIGG